jgi:hypothetical protein
MNGSCPLSLSLIKVFYGHSPRVRQYMQAALGSAASRRNPLKQHTVPSRSTIFLGNPIVEPRQSFTKCSTVWSAIRSLVCTATLATLKRALRWRNSRGDGHRLYR